MAENFYLLEETIDLLQLLKKNLRLQELSQAELLNKTALPKIQAILSNLDLLLSAKERDSRLLNLIVRVDGLKDFLLTLQKIVLTPGTERLLQQKSAKATSSVNEQLKRIIVGIDEWTTLAQQKIHAHQSGNFQNSYLDKLTAAPSTDFFYVFIKELNPVQTRYVHPFTPQQVASQKKRSTTDLLRYDALDPITGHRFFRAQDDQSFPGSGVSILTGHHRTYELYCRFVSGELSGDTLLLIRRSG